MTDTSESSANDINQFIENIGLVLESAGLTRAAGRIFGYLLVCDPPEQHAQAISHSISASTGSVSTNLRLLVQLGFVEKTALPGDRRTSYRVGPGAWDSVMEDQLRATIALREVAETGLQILPDHAPGRRERLQEAVDFFSFLEENFPPLFQRYHDEKGKNQT
ncbi:GbsR/MarR family transcriptional regulator [Corynebacterium alimapuense]|uniref:Transcriptional regulator n=1 Tax=Corynebacterium alimapuense TaxID=1576874 RepID=A0A3M8K5I4_9CORY|nr:transcriptional regulator [Corynebacterium alimapuense]RNE48360.1 transcriptional regulator [Corynebacterium alimapuense]